VQGTSWTLDTRKNNKHTPIVVPASQRRTKSCNGDCRIIGAIAHRQRRNIANFKKRRGSFHGQFHLLDHGVIFISPKD
jgi:hypothetical protein